MPTTKEVSKDEQSQINNILSVPHREQHLKQVEAFKQQAGGQTKVLGAPFFPYDGTAMLVETEGDRQAVEGFV
jgi:hypothetical protein